MKLQYEKSALSRVSLHLVGWVEPTPGFVGFLRLRRTNLHIAGNILKGQNPTTVDFWTELRSFFEDQETA